MSTAGLKDHWAYLKSVFDLKEMAIRAASVTPVKL